MIFPVFTEDIRWVGIATNMIELCNTGRYCVASLVEREIIMLFLQLSMRVQNCVDDCLVVAEHKTESLNWHS